MDRIPVVSDELADAGAESGRNSSRQPKKPSRKQAEAEAAEWLSTSRQLQRRATLIERDIFTPFLRAPDPLKGTMLALSQEVKALHEERNEEGKIILAQLARLKEGTAQISELVERPDEGEEFLVALGRLMRDHQMSMRSFKRRQASQYETLSLEAKRISSDLRDTQREVDSWALEKVASGVGTAAKPPQLATAARLGEKDVGSRFQEHLSVAELQQQTNLPKEVLEFEVFEEAHGGRCGGWLPEEHDAYLRAHTQLTYASDIIEATCKYVPTMGRAAVREHHEWYQQYSRLAAAKKKAVKEWRYARQKQDAKSTEAAAEDVGLMWEEDELREAKQTLRTRKDAMQKRTAIQAWKEEKRKTSEAEARKLEEERNRKRQGELRRLQEAERKKAAVAEYQKLKEHEKELSEDLQKRKKEAHRPTKADLVIRQRQDEKIIKERQAKIEAKRMACTPRQDVVSTLSVKSIASSSRSPTRVLRPTKAMVLRDEAKRESALEPDIKDRGTWVKGAASVKPSHMPHGRAVPTWRKDL
eukprot:Rmarinus@m.20377